MRRAHLTTALALLACWACSTSTATPTGPTETASTISSPASSTGTSTSAIYAQFTNGVTVSFDGATAVVSTSDLPDHKSPYWGTGHANYEAPHAGMQLTRDLIARQNVTFRIPTTPVSTTASDTPLGPIGVAVNGVVFFNQYNGMRQPLTAELLTFDRYNGHPSPSNQYHYHVEPVWLTASSRSRLLGVLLDGFPVYGPVEADGRSPSGLDSCNGHVGATAEFAAGIYHYHATAAAPYISGCFRGAPGTVR